MIKFIMCDLLPLLLDIDWIQTLLDIDLLQALLAIFPVVMIIGFAAALHTFIGNLMGMGVLFHKKPLLNEAGFHRPESPLWFALGP